MRAVVQGGGPARVDRPPKSAARRAEDQTLVREAGGSTD